MGCRRERSGHVDAQLGGREQPSTSVGSAVAPASEPPSATRGAAGRGTGAPCRGEARVDRREVRPEQAVALRVEVIVEYPRRPEVVLRARIAKGPPPGARPQPRRSSRPPRRVVDERRVRVVGQACGQGRRGHDRQPGRNQ
jgi:hypothetical protein